MEQLHKKVCIWVVRSEIKLAKIFSIVNRILDSLINKGVKKGNAKRLHARENESQ